MSLIRSAFRFAWSLRRLTRACGLDFERYDMQSADYQLWSAIRRHAITTVIDVGGNRGQYAMHLRDQGFRGDLHSIEPFPGAFAELAATSRRDARWFAHQIALGAATGTAILHIGANDQTSSLKPTVGVGNELQKIVSTVGTAEVEVCTLSDFLRDNCLDPAHTLLKLDVQGSEYDIMTGSRDMLTQLPLLFIECSVVPIYQGDVPLGDMIAFLRDAGFGVIGLKGGYFSPDNGEMMQVDLLAENLVLRSGASGERAALV